MDVPTNLPHNTWTPGAARGFCTLDPSLRLTQGNDQKETLKERWKRGAKHSMRVALSSKALGGLTADLKAKAAAAEAPEPAPEELPAPEEEAPAPEEPAAAAEAVAPKKLGAGWLKLKRSVRTVLAATGRFTAAQIALEEKLEHAASPEARDADFHFASAFALPAA